MALARIITPQGLMNTELKSKVVKEVARLLEAALCVGREEDDTGIFINLIEIGDGQFGVGEKIPTLFQLLDILGGDLSLRRRDEMKRLFLKRLAT